MRRAEITALVLALALSHARAADSWVLENTTALTYQDEAVRLHLAAPDGAFKVKEDGREVAYQIEELDGRRFIWVLVTADKGAKHTYTLEPGAPGRFEPRVKVASGAGAWVFENGVMGVKVPSGGEALTPPVLSLKLPDGTWVGKGYWKTARKLTKFTPTLLANGAVFAKARLRYDFDGSAGLDGASPAYAVVDVALYPSQRHVTITEQHEMGREDGWEFDCAAGWGARAARCQIFGGGAGVSPNPAIWPKNLKPLGWDPAAIEQRYEQKDPRLGDTLMWLVPRGNQHYQDGWLFTVGDGRQVAGAMVCRAGMWVWPHDNKLAIHAKDSAGYAGLYCPTRRGSRHWFLIAATEGDLAGGKALQYVKRYGFQGLDKLLYDFITSWPGKDGLFYGGRSDPVAMKRSLAYGQGGAWNGGSTPLDTLTGVQMVLDPDVYGSYWTFWSPENPNFFTDYYKGAIWKTKELRDHPRFKELALLAEMQVREDVYHSVTLPGGAGQECPGYFDYAMGSLRPLVRECTEFLGSDPKVFARLEAGPSFLRHISQPDGSVRRFHPGGDTHPGKDGGGTRILEVAPEEAQKYVTEELPGFGLVFHNRPGTPKETYLAFKSGPNRGHYHGDQLSFHYCADAHGVAVDHHCSYGPRAGQEHMHNRVAFHTDALPYANMDGYERVIGFKTSAVADAGIGQVEGERLRWVKEFPPEDWDREYPQARFDVPLTYRRTVVLVKNGPADYFVIRDQYAGPEVYATYCLHVLGATCEHQGPWVQFDKLSIFVAEPAQFSFSRKDWQHTNGGLEATKGARLTVKGARSQFITVLYPRADASAAPPAISALPGGVRVGGDEVTFAGGIDQQAATTYVTVKRDGQVVLALTGADLNLDRFQGDIGLFVPDAGYRFGEIPDWLIKQRAKKPDWYQPVLPLGWPKN